MKLRDWQESQRGDNQSNPSTWARICTRDPRILTIMACKKIPLSIFFFHRPFFLPYMPKETALLRLCCLVFLFGWFFFYPSPPMTAVVPRIIHLSYPLLPYLAIHNSSLEHS
ncbi:hypothetical protein GQ53DRAFT_427414 [Thozetella sp. PMI_491]|nr:hypothetical protein GQ53DRAFT_427414 [Thozetella sp. PMI_491]